MLRLLTIKSIYRRNRRVSSSLNSVSSLSSLDKLLRVKPALIRDLEKEEDKFDGKPSPNDFISAHESDPPLRLGKEILKFGKIYYQHIDKIPTWITERLFYILENRTTAQVRRNLQSWMIAYDRDDQVLYKNRKVGWRNTIPASIPKAISYGPEETVVYSRYFFNSRYALLARVLDELKLVKPNFVPRTVLDYGCGPGTGFAAVRQVWDNADNLSTFNTILTDEKHKNSKKRTPYEVNQPNTTKSYFKKSNPSSSSSTSSPPSFNGFTPPPSVMSKYVGVDISQAMLDAARVMSDNQGIDCIFWDKISNVVQNAKEQGQRYDLIICSYTLNEFTMDASRKAAVQILFELLNEDGVIVFLEPGNPLGSHTVRTARQYILNFFNQGLDSSHADLAVDEDAEVLKAREEELRKQEEVEERRQEQREGMSDGDDDLPPTKVHYKKKTYKPKHTSSLYTPPPIRFILPPPNGRKSNSELKASVISPCTHDRPCPLGQGVWCSFGQKVCVYECINMSVSLCVY